MIKIIVAAHCALAAELVNAVVAISGAHPNLYFVERSSNSSSQHIYLTIETLLKDIIDDDGVLILTDLLGGSPCNAAMQASMNLKVEVISGVNLPMVLSAIMLSTTNTNLSELARKVLNKGQKSIANIKKLLEEHQNTICKRK
jgi:mannose/fructose/sorbose-specific phosphotransferase system IIA component